MRTTDRIGLWAGMLLGIGLLTGCVTGGEDRGPVAGQLPVTEEAEATGAASTLTGEGPVQHTYNCPPAAEVDQPGAPSVEVGVSAPVPVGHDQKKAGGTKVYTRYNCN